MANLDKQNIRGSGATSIKKGFCKVFILQTMLVAATTITILLPQVNAQYHPSQGHYNDLAGDFCRTRRDPCCRGRMDDCSHAILGTLCYCDQFCNRTEAPDCCPDYWESCLGIPAPTTEGPPTHTACHYKGRYYGFGETTKDNCNECECVEGGKMSCDTSNCLIDPSLIDRINQGNHGWQASNYSMFWGRKLAEGLTYRTGTITPSIMALRMYPVTLIYDPSGLPREFDARTHSEWIGNVMGARDQGWCGSSWAFSTLDVFADRLAIESNGKERDVLSAQNLISCAKRGQQGCNGGYIERAWSYLRKYGVVNEECYQYTSGTSTQVGNCRIPRRTNILNLRCASESQVMNNRKDLYRAEPAYRIKSEENDIMYEIMSNGPVQATMRVYEDLFLYKSGVYTSTSLGATGKSSTHSVRIVGWGEQHDHHSQRGVKYWIAANSWGQEWGDRGFFKIGRGRNESDIEQFVITARARLDGHRLNVRRSRQQSNHNQRHRFQA